MNIEIQTNRKLPVSILRIKIWQGQLNKTKAEYCQWIQAKIDKWVALQEFLNANLGHHLKVLYKT